MHAVQAVIITRPEPIRNRYPTRGSRSRVTIVSTQFSSPVTWMANSRTGQDASRGTLDSDATMPR